MTKPTESKVDYPVALRFDLYATDAASTTNGGGCTEESPLICHVSHPYNNNNLQVILKKILINAER